MRTSKSAIVAGILGVIANGANGAPRPDLLTIQSTSVELAWHRNPEIAAAEDLRRVVVVEYQFTNNATEPVWVNMCNPVYVGEGRFLQHYGDHPSSWGAFQNMSTRKLAPGESGSVTFRYPYLPGHASYTTSFAAGSGLSKRDSKRLRDIHGRVDPGDTPWDDEEVAADTLDDLISDQFSPQSVEIQIPENHEQEPLTINVVKIDAVMKWRPDNEDDRSKPPELRYLKHTLRFANQSKEPIIVFANREEKGQRLGAWDSLRWPDSVRFMRLPTIHLMEIAPGSSIDITFRSYSVPRVVVFAYAAGLSREDHQTLLEMNNTPAKNDRRAWIINTTKTVSVPIEGRPTAPSD